MVICFDENLEAISNMQDLSFQPMVFDVFLMLKDWIIRGGIIA
jgi:hypothetical protein